MSEKELKTKGGEATRRHHLTREEEADRSLNHTDFGPGAMKLVTALFLLTVFGVPVVQHVVEIRENMAKRAAWKPESGQPEPHLLPEAYTIGKLLPSGKQISEARGFWGYWGLITSAESILKFEEDLKASSVLTRSLLSPAQAFMSGTLGVGNEKAYMGEPGWLFYRPDVDYLTSDGFLKPSVLRARSHALNEIQPNPIKAILDTRDQLKARGITLVMMPVPTKPMIQAEKLIGEKGRDLRLQNESYAEFVATMEREGIPVYDATDKLFAAKAQEAPYLETDTHWTPKAMGMVADDLAKFLTEKTGLEASGNAGYTLKPTPVSHLGDIAEMLKLPKDQTLFKPQSVTIEAVQEADGTPWQLKPEADVLLLGDSFANIFSLGGMGWGESAGLAERLSYALQRPVDKMVINAGGAFSSRQDLQARMARGDDRLAGKKVVIWEFSMRDLAQGDWKMIQLKQSSASKPSTSEVAQEMTVTGRIAEKANPPQPGQVPYKDCVIALHLTDLKVEGGTLADKDIVVYVWGMQDNKLVDSSYAKDGTVTLKLTPWNKAEGKYGGYNRMELENLDALDWPAFWGEVKK
ncbi:MAG: alginate O-acetyltransferase AlgX-related protein [Fimbriimonas sp.]